MAKVRFVREVPYVIHRTEVGVAAPFGGSQRKVDLRKVLKVKREGYFHTDTSTIWAVWFAISNEQEGQEIAEKVADLLWPEGSNWIKQLKRVACVEDCPYYEGDLY